MPLSMYDTSIPVFVRSLRNLLAILEKGEAFAKEKGIDSRDLVETRLIEDMDPLRSQIQRASDSAKGAAARLSGTEIPSFPDTETSFPELKARIERTIAYLEGFGPERIDGSETRQVTINTRRTAINMEGQDYLLRFALPNFFFHVTTAYDILRHKGVPVGKMDYIGAL